MKKYYFFLFLSLFSLSILRGQPPIPTKPSPPRLVNDYANMLSPSEAQQLERVLDSYADSTTTQITIVTIADLGDYAIEDWAVEIGKKWGVGTGQKNNGVVILVGLAPKNRIFIATGPGVQGFLPDIMCKRIITESIVPNFKQKRFYDGFTAAIKSIRGLSKGEFVNNHADSSGSDEVMFWIFMLIMIAFVIFIIWMSNRRGNVSQYGTRRRNWNDNGGGGWMIFNGGGGFGGGSSSNDSDGGGGFGGFGGGDFDGGGAGGDW